MQDQIKHTWVWEESRINTLSNKSQPKGPVPEETKPRKEMQTCMSCRAWVPEMFIVELHLFLDQTNVHNTNVKASRKWMIERINLLALSSQAHSSPDSSLQDLHTPRLEVLSLFTVAALWDWAFYLRSIHNVWEVCIGKERERRQKKRYWYRKEIWSKSIAGMYGDVRMKSPFSTVSIY